jgi:hypothetical protein
MILCKTLVDAKIPLCNKMQEAIIHHWPKIVQKLEAGVLCMFEHISSPLQLANSSQKLSCGQINFTADIWSNANMLAYLALTSHWISLDNSTGTSHLKVQSLVSIASRQDTPAPN